MKLTPQKISRRKEIYSIPIYQRLFEWDSDNVITLLGDLKGAFEHGKEDYYIGLLTSTTNNELVDGQQRFTVMMLMGCVLQNYYTKWSDFLQVGEGRMRLHFACRPMDESYMQYLINQKDLDSSLIENYKMKNGIKEINGFIDALPVGKRKKFAEYVFNHMCFFITELPVGYNPRDLNRYFERMNTTGKNLEQHEILKVKMLKHLSGNISSYMSLWNKLADVDTLLIRKIYNKTYKESDEGLAQRKNKAFISDIDTLINDGVINGLGREDREVAVSISQIQLSEKAPSNDTDYNRDTHCSLTFPYLLLQTLYRFLDGTIHGNISDFFKPNNLLETFQTHLPYEGKNVNPKNIKKFLELLVKGRLALDICFIRPSEYGYSLDLNCSEDDPELKRLLMLESMIFVSSSNYTHYRWFGWLMDSIKTHKGIPSAIELFQDLKNGDDELDEHKQIPDYDSLSFGDEIRYWFWRLDFYIWEHRGVIFKDSKQALNVADNYVFKRNRSIEHIAPQQPEGNSKMKWDDTEEDKSLRDSFGNLVMISQGLNSALSNKSFEVKTAHVQSFTHGSKTGSIESLKLLVVDESFAEWDRDSIKSHGQKMYDWLKKSYDNIPPE